MSEFEESICDRKGKREKIKNEIEAVKSRLEKLEKDLKEIDDDETWAW